jgi:arylsulfatase
MAHQASRRGFLQGLGALAAAAAVPTLRSAAQAQPTAAGSGRPNIVVILADDLGFADIGCYGSEIATPNLDRLAGEGVRLTQFYNCARCCPTRAALLTGLYPHEAGVGHMVENRGRPQYQGFLRDDCVTIAEALRPAGYRTLMSGKWHVGGKRPHWPVDRGFDRYFGLLDGASSYFALDEGRNMALDDQPWAPPAEGFYMTDAITDHAVQFLSEPASQAQPFFLYLAYTAPHWPVHALPEDIARYRGRYRDGWDALRRARHQRQIEMGLVDPKWPLSPRDDQAPPWDDVTDPDHQDLKMAAYAAQIDRMDQGIGRVLATLAATGADRNTLVLFLADNGACAEAVERAGRTADPGTPESYIAYGLPWANAGNTPLRLFKQRIHEGGIASPLVAWWPGRLPAGTISPQVGHVMDLMPTCLEAAGVAYPQRFNGRTITPLSGRSLLAPLRGAAPQRREPIFWEHQGNRGVRDGDWKLVSIGRNDWELYDLAADRTELNDLAAAEPARVAAMSAMYDAWAERIGVVPFHTLPRPTRPATTRAAE